MKKVENSILFWGIYILALGFALVLFPVKTVSLFGYNGNDDLWIRFTGILSVVLGLYYIQIAKNRISVLYRWKIIGHIFGMICMIAFLASDVADKRIIGTLVVEFLGFAWTLITLWVNHYSTEKTVFRNTYTLKKAVHYGKSRHHIL